MFSRIGHLFLFLFFLFFIFCWNHDIKLFYCGNTPAFTQLCSQAFMLSITSIGSIAVRFLAGHTTSKEKDQDLLLEFGCIALSGLLTLLFPIISHYPVGWFTYCILFGLYTGSLVTLFSPISVGLLGVSELPIGFGSTLVAAGTGYISGPPVIGELFHIISICMANHTSILIIIISDISISSI